MYIYSVLSFSISVIYIGIGIFAFSQGRNKYVNWIFLLLCSSFYLFAVPFSFISFVQQDSSAYVVLRVIIFFGKCMYPPLLLHLAYLITSKKYSNNKSIFAAYVPNILVFIMSIIFITFFHDCLWLQELIEGISNIFSILYGIATLLLFYVWITNKKSSTEIRQRRIVLGSAIICLVGGLICEVVVHKILSLDIELGHFFPVVLVCGFAYAISVLGFLNIENCIPVYRILDKCNDFVVIVDYKGKIIRCNKKLLSTFGYSEKQLYMKTISILMPELFRNIYEEEEILSDICGKDMEAYIFKQYEGKVPVKLLVSPINHIEDLIGYVLIAQDITNILLLEQEISERKEAEMQLMTLMESNRALVEETLKYDKLKTEFFSNISHELKTPLNVLLSAIQLSEYYIKNQSPLDLNKLQKNNTYMKHNCFRLLKLIGNLLDVTKIDSGFFKVNYINGNIIYFVENLVDSIQPYTMQRKINVSFDTDTEIKIIKFDPYIIETIILNILSNALKYTPEKGEVILSITVKNEDIFISISDNGVGIAEDKLEMIFERFTQINPLMTRMAEGTGIGLSLVKSLVEMLDGTIDVKSKVGVGTTFTIKLPCTLADDCITVNDINLYSHNFTTNNIDRVLIQFSDIPFEQ